MKGCRESDNKPIELVDVQAKKKKIFMDEAIAKTRMCTVYILKNWI